MIKETVLIETGEYAGYLLSSHYLHTNDSKLVRLIVVHDKNNVVQKTVVHEVKHD